MDYDGDGYLDEDLCPGTGDDCDDDDPATPELECILDFKGGYCGRKDCDQSDHEHQFQHAESKTCLVRGRMHLGSLQKI